MVSCPPPPRRLKLITLVVSEVRMDVMLEGLPGKTGSEQPASAVAAVMAG
jgi:hypothetical protein